MSDNTSFNSPTKAGTIGGTLLVLLLHIQSDEVVKTILLAGVGAATSFGVSKVLQWLVKRFRT